MKMYDDKESSNVSFEVKEEIIRAHLCILKAREPSIVQSSLPCVHLHRLLSRAFQIDSSSAKSCVVICDTRHLSLCICTLQLLEETEPSNTKNIPLS